MLIKNKNSHEIRDMIGTIDEETKIYGDHSFGGGNIQTNMMFLIFETFELFYHKFGIG